MNSIYSMCNRQFLMCILLWSGHVSADLDSAEDTDPDVAIDEEEEDEDVVVEEDQIQATVCFVAKSELRSRSFKMEVK